MRHRWQRRNWWTRALSTITLQGNTQTCMRCGAKLRTTKAPSLARRGTFRRRYEYLWPDHFAQTTGYVPIRQIPPCYPATSGAAVP